MPRKRKPARFSEYKIPKIDPGDRHAVEDHDLVRHVLVDFDEVAVLPDETRKQLVEDLVHAIRYAHGGVKAGKRGLSDKAVSQQIFLSDVGRALEQAGLPVTRWRKQYDNDGGESFYFRLTRELADTFDITLPKDLKLPAKRATQHQYGAMSLTMQAAQEAEILSPRQPAVWGHHLVDAPRSCEELASAYLGLPF